MNLLDHGPHTVIVYPQSSGTDARGNRVSRPADVGVTVRGATMTPIASGRRERDQDGRITADYDFFARSAPLGPWARIEWRGHKFAVVAGPYVFDHSPGVAHVAARLREER